MSLSISSGTNTYDYMNNFFSGLNSSSTSSSSSGISSLFGDLYSIQNGSYLKLAKKYYASEEAGDSVADDKLSAMAKNESKSASDALSNLMDKSLYNKTTVTSEDGSSKEDYDRKAILEALKGFATEYNSLIETTGDMEDTSVLKNSVNMVNQTKVYEGALSDIGITIGSDNKLSVDEDAFAKADITDVKSLFTGGISFATNASMKLSQVYTSASSALNSSGSLYNSNGVTSISTGTMFNSLF